MVSEGKKNNTFDSNDSMLPVATVISTMTMEKFHEEQTKLKNEYETQLQNEQSRLNEKEEQLNKLKIEYENKLQFKESKLNEKEEQLNKLKIEYEKSKQNRIKYDEDDMFSNRKFIEKIKTYYNNGSSNEIILRQLLYKATLSTN